MAAAAGAAATALGFVMAGHHPPAAWVAAGGAPGAAGGLILAFRRRVTHEAAAAVADRFFDLADGLTSALGFERDRRLGGIYRLQAAHTGAGIAAQNPDAVRRPPPWRVAILAVVLLGAAGFLGTFADSPAVAARGRQRQDTLLRTETAAERLKAAVRELAQTLTDEQREALDRAGIRRMIDELGPVEDAREALRALAEIERRARDLPVRQQVANDARYLEQAGREMQRRRQDTPLARALVEGRHADAAKALARQKLDAGEHPESQPAASPDALGELSDRAGRLRQATEGMKAASQRLADLDSQARELGEQLADAAEATSSQLAELQRNCEGGACSEAERARADEQAADCDARLAALGDAMEGLESRSRFLAKLDDLMKDLNRCQGYVAGQCDLPEGRNARGIGSGDHGQTADRTDPPDGRGEQAQLTGRHGSGPSLVAVVDAPTGEGVRRVSSQGRREQFRRQVESIIRREDVPPSLKTGVKLYFERIHDAAPAVDSPSPAGQEHP